MPHFTRKRFRWGPPQTWQGWIFLALWGIALIAVSSQPPTASGGIALVVLLAFLMFVLARDK